MKTKTIAAICVGAALTAASTVHAMTDTELKTVTATIINLNGHLCASVVDIRALQLQDQYEVTCVEYRGGSGTVRYIMNARKGTAFKA